MAEWLPQPEFCEKHGIGRSTLYTWLSRGKALGRGKRRHRRYILNPGYVVALQRKKRRVVRLIDLLPPKERADMVLSMAGAIIAAVEALEKRGIK